MSLSTHTFVALLRGINVGGNSLVKMNDLRRLFENLGFANVRTHIQSGNVLFATDESDRAKLTRKIEQELESFLGRKIVVFILTPRDLERAAARNPFEPERRQNEQVCQLLFLKEKPSAANRKAIMALQGEEYRFHLDGTIFYYAYSKDQAGRRRQIPFEKALGTTGTARTWKVINSLIALAGG